MTLQKARQIFIRKSVLNKDLDDFILTTKESETGKFYQYSVSLKVLSPGKMFNIYTSIVGKNRITKKEALRSLLEEIKEDV